MILSLPELKSRSLIKGLTKTARHVIAEAAATPPDNEWDVFLSYSSKDREALPPIMDRLAEEGLLVYVDRIADADLDPSSVDDNTAERLRLRIRHSRALFVLTSVSAAASRWVPWELGFADGANKRVAILPFIDTQPTPRSYSGNEYLKLYPYIDEYRNKASRSCLWANAPERPYEYCELRNWLDGRDLSLDVDFLGAYLDNILRSLLVQPAAAGR
jgi:hypothetical protein